MGENKATGVETWVNEPKKEFKEAVKQERRTRNLTYIRKKSNLTKKRISFQNERPITSNQEKRMLKNQTFRLNQKSIPFSLKESSSRQTTVNSKEDKLNVSESEIRNLPQTSKSLQESPSRQPTKHLKDKRNSKEKDYQKEKQKKTHRIVQFVRQETQEKVKEESGYNDTVFGEAHQGMNTVRATKDGIKSVVHIPKQTVKSTTKVAKSSYSLLKNSQRFFIETQKRLTQVGRWVAKFIANPLVIFKGISIGGLGLLIVGLLMIIVVSVTSTFSSVTTKSDELELTKTWRYFTELDADRTLAIQNGKKELEINGSYANRDKVQIRSNINEVLAYLDTTYGDFELDGKLPPTNESTKNILSSLHQSMIKQTSSKDKETIDMKPVVEVIPENEELTEQLNGLMEMGQFIGLEELAAPIENQEQLFISQRYGYFVKDKKKEFFDGIALEAPTGSEVVAPLSGELSIKENEVTISTKNQTLILQNISPKTSLGETITSGQTIGTTIDQDNLTVTYLKNGQSVNPAFYLPNAQYMETSELGFSYRSSAFDENRFRSVIRLKGNAFSQKADKIIEEAKNAGVSPIIFAAIMIHESAWGTSQAIREHNNPSGQMSGSRIIHYETLDKGIEATGRTLHNLIVERKLHTVELLGSVYCPIGADNDPLGLNKYWVPAIKQFMEQLGGQKEMSLLWSSASGKGEEALEIAFSLHQKGVQYSQQLNQRGQFPYHDCSSFVTWAMKQVGIDVSLGSTEYLYGLEGTILQPISRAEVKAGDIFVWGRKGQSSGDFGHTGFFIDDGGKHILHATPATRRGFGQNGDVVETPFEGYYGDSNLAPVYFYRIIG